MRAGEGLQREREFSVFQCVAVCSSVLLRVVMCYCGLQCVTVWCSVEFSVMQCVTICCKVVQCVWCSVSQCVAVYCNVVQCVAVCCG